jgi:hypothetical protein
VPTCPKCRRRATFTTDPDGIAAIDDVGTHARRVAASPGGRAKQHCIYDPESGPPLADSFMHDAMPRSGDLPYFATDISEVALTTHPLGFRGGGEGRVSLKLLQRMIALSGRRFISPTVCEARGDHSEHIIMRSNLKF